MAGAALIAAAVVAGLAAGAALAMWAFAHLDDNLEAI